MTLLDTLRLLSTGVWAATLLIFSPALLRWFFGRSKRRDATKASIWFVAAIFIGFGLRWLVFQPPAVSGTEYSVWAGLYVLSILGAGMITYTGLWDE